MFEFSRKTLFSLEKRLSKHKITVFYKFGGAMDPFAPPLATPMLKPAESQGYTDTFCNCIEDRTIGLQTHS